MRICKKIGIGIPVYVGSVTKKRIETLRELLKTTTDEALRVQIKKEINQLTGWIETSDPIQVIQ